MAKISQRTWKIPGQRTKRKAWGFTLQVHGKQVKRYRAEWTREVAEKSLAEFLVRARETSEEPKPKPPAMTLGEALDRCLELKARRRARTLDDYRRHPSI